MSHSFIKNHFLYVVKWFPNSVHTNSHHVHKRMQSRLPLNKFLMALTWTCTCHCKCMLRNCSFVFLKTELDTKYSPSCIYITFPWCQIQVLSPVNYNHITGHLLVTGSCPWVTSSCHHVSTHSDHSTQHSSSNSKQSSCSTPCAALFLDKTCSCKV